MMWLDDLCEVADQFSHDHGRRLPLSGHLCGRWVGQVVNGGHFGLAEKCPQLLQCFARIQVNLRGSKAVPKSASLIAALAPFAKDHAFILQVPEFDDPLLLEIRVAGIPIVPLFDRSAGHGKLPDVWPAPLLDVPCGYSGGLGPDNLATELEEIKAAASGAKSAPIWVDMQSGVRSSRDKDSDRAKPRHYFDLIKARRCLEVAQRFIEM